MAESGTPTPPRIRALFPELELFLPSPPRTSSPLTALHHHFTVPRMRRGPRYSAYSDLRESKLRKKKKREGSPSPGTAKTPPMPQKKAAMPKTPSPLVARSVPNFSAALRKENRNPVWGSPAAPPKGGAKPTVTPPRPPPPTSVALSRTRSSSARGREKGCGGLRTSYSCLKELTGFSGVAATGIEEEGRAVAGRNGVVKRLSRRY